ncbi:hypothetical protein SVAN01_00170 [Stagonosporopsis vannaccii]|nr:hypothetical protein SVAN01_00170 [Stagonosporopsis vannaccii]
MDDAQLVVWNTVVVDFAVFTDVVMLNCSVCSAWQGFQLGITATMLACWLQASKAPHSSDRRAAHDAGRNFRIQTIVLWSITVPSRESLFNECKIFSFAGCSPPVRDSRTHGKVVNSKGARVGAPPRAGDNAGSVRTTSAPKKDGNAGNAGHAGRGAKARLLSRQAPADKGEERAGWSVRAHNVHWTVRLYGARREAAKQRAIAQLQQAQRGTVLWTDGVSAPSAAGGAAVACLLSSQTAPDSLIGASDLPGVHADLQAARCAAQAGRQGVWPLLTTHCSAPERPAGRAATRLCLCAALRCWQAARALRETARHKQTAATPRQSAGAGAAAPLRHCDAATRL